jgi:hypothetical protein
MGWGAIGLRFEGDSIAPLNGTSFSSPILAGLVACLWQLHPGRSSSEIMDAVRRSASLFNDPNDSLGYGIPNFELAHEALDATTSIDFAESAETLRAYPVPFGDHLDLLLPNALAGSFTLELFDPTGRMHWSASRMASGRERIRLDGLQGLGAGLYILRLRSSGAEHVLRVMKQ